MQWFKGESPGRSACTAQELCDKYGEYYGGSFANLIADGNMCRRASDNQAAKGFTTHQCSQDFDSAFVTGSSGGCMENFCENGGVPDSLETCSEPPPPPPGKCTDPHGLLYIGPEPASVISMNYLTPEDEEQARSWCNPMWLDQPCENPVGEFNGRLVCDDERQECENAGGTYGIAEFSRDGEKMSTMAVCYPSNYADDLPTCEEGTIHYLDVQDGTFGFACATPDEYVPEDVPGQEDQEGDIDGDGTPDHEDDDMDGDGISNDQDSDADGDGTDDSEQDGPVGNDGKTSLSGGGDCNSAPQCKGDPIACAIHFQTWKSRCAAENLTEEIGDPNKNPGELDLSDGGELVSALDGAFLDGVNELTGEGNQGIESGTSALESAMTGILPSVPACQDFVINFAQGNIVISCEKLATFRDIIGWALYILTAWHLFMIATTPMQSRV